MGDSLATLVAAPPATAPRKHSVLNSSFPVLVPEFARLSALTAAFELKPTSQGSGVANNEQTIKDITNELKALRTQDGGSPETKEVSHNTLKRPAPFEADNPRPSKVLLDENKTLTGNADVTNISSKNALVDLFYDIGEGTPHSQLDEVLHAAWKEDALLTLKIMFNARSIHLGKSSRKVAYSALGWLAVHHPKTFLANLSWLVRPVIAKKPSKPGIDAHNADDDFEIITVDNGTTTSTVPNEAHDVCNGTSHGYWKDLLNLVVFAANDQLKVDGDFDSLLNQKPDDSNSGKRKRWENDQDTARELRRKKNKDQNERVQHKLNSYPFYRALHVKVTQLFIDQLKTDKAVLDSGKHGDLRKLSLAAKWAPTFGEFHDKHTFILSSIAEALFPDPALHCPDASNRELYLRHVRELYRKQYASPLRKALEVVERDIVAGMFGNIDYSHVPSMAMNRYTDLFIHKDEERFTNYINKVTDGTAAISGATLLPSTLVQKAFETQLESGVPLRKGNIGKGKAGALQRELQRKVVDGQWRTLVKSVSDAGALQSSIAVCDVSGSMTYPMFRDGSKPMDSAIGLSLLIASVTTGPFGGNIITFSAYPRLVSFNEDNKLDKLCSVVGHVRGMDWGMNTDLVLVFERLLETAQLEKIPQAEMVKQVFVFSDMQFDSAMNPQDWSSSFDRIKRAYTDAGYDMPKLIFWNLAGQTSKPVTMDDQNVALVSGYSHGMLKAFLETGALYGEEEIVEEIVVGEDGMVEVKNKEKIDPLIVEKNADGHKAYSMQEVID